LEIVPEYVAVDCKAEKGRVEEKSRNLEAIMVDIEWLQKEICAARLFFLRV